MAAGQGADAPAERTGRVVDGSGTALPDALVTIVESSVPMPEIALLCDEHGRFALRLPPGRFTLRAHAEGASGDAAVEGAPATGEILIVVGG